MRARTAVQIIIVAAVAVILGYLVVWSADDWADWIVLGVVICAALGGALAVWNRQYPAATTKRTFTRDSDSEW